MTTHGTIFGHDKAQDIKAVRKFGAFAGTTWLRHDKAIAETGQALTEPDFGLGGKTHKVVIANDGKHLHSMIVEIDGMISAICVVKEKILLAAQKEKVQFKGETDEIAGMFEVLELGMGEDEGGVAGAVTREKGRGVENATISNESEPGMVTNVGKAPENGATVGSSSPPKAQLSKIRILEIRAESMAREFEEDICGHEFFMPAEFM